MSKRRFKSRNQKQKESQREIVSQKNKIPIFNPKRMTLPKGTITKDLILTDGGIPAISAGKNGGNVTTVINGDNNEKKALFIDRNSKEMRKIIPLWPDDLILTIERNKPLKFFKILYIDIKNKKLLLLEVSIGELTKTRNKFNIISFNYLRNKYLTA